jgi:hypothetical protein
MRVASNVMNVLVDYSSFINAPHEFFDDTGTNQIAPDTESSEDLFILCENLLTNQPCEGPLLQPIAEEPYAEILNRRGPI